ncbi:short chain dehydrogenase family protein, partial [Vibrio parahaemolyticus V-223/04]
ISRLWNGASRRS